MKFKEEKNLKNEINKIYSDCVYNGNSYKLLNPNEKEISIYRCNNVKITDKKLCNSYTKIANNKEKKLYYVIKKDENSKIYILDDKYNEFDVINLKIENKYKKEIKSIEYNNKEKIIYICLDSLIYSVTLCGCFIKEELTEEAINKMKYIEPAKYNRCKYTPPKDCINLTAISYINKYIYVAYKIKYISYIAKISRKGNIIENYFVDEDIDILSIINVNERIELLILKCKKYNSILTTTPEKCKYKNIDHTPVICHEHCHHEKKCDINCELGNVIHSIANIEKALAELIIVEAQKVKKIIEISHNTEEILKINDSVNKTIKNITILEQELVDKLSLTLNHLKCHK